MKPNVNMELARVTFSNAETYAIDVVTESRKWMNDVPYLSLYGKNDDEGQGIYMLPEVGSYVFIFQTIDHCFAFGFINHFKEDEGFSGKREVLSPGDFCLKTVAKNKILGTKDGVLLLQATDICKFELFPFSGVVLDSAGVDNLIRMFMENMELHTDGGYWHWKVDKKERETNFKYHFRNRPLSEDDPDIFRGNIGSQHPDGDFDYFVTHQQLHTEDDEQTEIIRVDRKEKTCGYKIVKRYDIDENHVFEWEEDNEGNKRRVTFNADGEKLHEIDLKHTGVLKETQFRNNDPIWVLEREICGTTTLKMPGDGDKIMLRIGSEGNVTLEIDQSLNIVSKKGDVNVDVLQGEVNVNAKKDITINTNANAMVRASGVTTVEGNSVLLGIGASEPAVKGMTLKAYLDTHIHVDGNGIPTTPPTSPLPGGALSNKVKVE